MLLLLGLLLGAPRCFAVKLKFSGQECMMYDLKMYNSVYGGFVALPDAYGVTPLYDFVVTSPADTKVGACSGWRGCCMCVHTCMQLIMGPQHAALSIISHATSNIMKCVASLPSGVVLSPPFVGLRDAESNRHKVQSDAIRNRPLSLLPDAGE